MKRFLRLHAFFFALTRPNKIKARIPLGQALDTQPDGFHVVGGINLNAEQGAHGAPCHGL